MAKDIFRIQHSAQSPKSRVLRKYKRNEVSELWQGDQTNSMSDQSVIGNRFFTFRAGLLIIACILVGRLFYLQVLVGATYLARAEGNYIRTQIIDAPRGLLYDRNGNQLVKNNPQFYLSFVPADLPIGEMLDRQQQKIADVMDVDVAALSQVIEKTSPISYRPVVLIDHLEYEQVVRLRTTLDNWSGLEVGVRGAREYTLREYMSHILGYLGRITADDLDTGRYDDYQLTDYLGKSGIEQQYEHMLRGTPGKREVEINVRGQVQKVLHEEEAVSGAHLTLTIDAAVQQKLYELMKAQTEKIGTTKAAAVAIEPSTGDILAAVSLPSYDNNIFSGRVDADQYAELINNDDKPLFFRPFLGEYPSGSTFKPLIALAALHEGVVTPATSFLSQGGIQINQWFFPDWKAGGHGTTNLVKAIAESVNTYFYIVGGGYDDRVGLGVDRIVDFAESFFFTRSLGIDFPFEANGFLPSRKWKEDVKGERWYVGDTYNISIGQGDVLVTPVQITAYMAYLANNGVFMQPRLLREIEQPDGSIVIVPTAQLQTPDINLDNIKVIREGLQATVDWGSARSLGILYPYKVAGKTGTAQVGGDQDPHSWFTSFAPYEQPTIALTLLFENGSTNGLGSAATPVALEFYRWYSQYQPELSTSD